MSKRKPKVRSNKVGKVGQGSPRYAKVGQGRQRYAEVGKVAQGRRTNTPVENLAELVSCVLTWLLILFGFALVGFLVYKLAALITG